MGELALRSVGVAVCIVGLLVVLAISQHVAGASSGVRFIPSFTFIFCFCFPCFCASELARCVSLGRTTSAPASLAVTRRWAPQAHART